MTRLVLFLLILSLTRFIGAQPLELYVSPGGDDISSGAAAKPFATLARARDEIRRRKPHGAVVHLRGGMYTLREPLIFAPEDSGTPDAPIIYEAMKGENPIFSGGVVIAGWKTNDKGIWQTQIPNVQKGEWIFAQLFVNGQRRFRPRLPKQNYFHIAGEVPPTPASAQRGHDRFRFNPDELRRFAFLTGSCRDSESPRLTTPTTSRRSPARPARPTTTESCTRGGDTCWRMSPMR